MPVAVLPTAKSLSAFSLKPQSDRLLEPTLIEFRALVEDLPMLGEINPDLYRKSMTRNAANDRG